MNVRGVGNVMSVGKDQAGQLWAGNHRVVYEVTSDVLKMPVMDNLVDNIKTWRIVVFRAAARPRRLLRPNVEFGERRVDARGDKGRAVAVDDLQVVDVGERLDGGAGPRASRRDTWETKSFNSRLKT